MMKAVTAKVLPAIVLLLGATTLASAMPRPRLETAGHGQIHVAQIHAARFNDTASSAPSCSERESCGYFGGAGGPPGGFSDRN